jgi:hypothetical protein
MHISNAVNGKGRSFYENCFSMKRSKTEYFMSCYSYDIVVVVDVVVIVAAAH